LPIRLLDHYVEPLFVASAVAGIVIGLSSVFPEWPSRRRSPH
jgi:hypothetical protein